VTVLTTEHLILAPLSHALIERNRPETFRAPFASLAADFVMAYHVLRGTIDQQLAPAAAEE